MQRQATVILVDGETIQGPESKFGIGVMWLVIHQDGAQRCLPWHRVKAVHYDAQEGT